MNTDPEVLAGKICPYCGEPTAWVDDTVVYGRTFGNKCYLCLPCLAYVGCHKPATHQSLGRLANVELREHKILAHHYFDQLWSRKIAKESISKTKARKAAYKWLSKEINIPVELCHIGYFGIEECKMVVNACKPIVEKFKK